MPVNQLWAYCIAITLLTLTPGVDTMLVIRNTTRGGWKDGTLSSLGICLGLFIHATVSAVGISVLLLQSAWAFRALKLAGAAYLIWLGIVSLRGAMAKNSTIPLADSPRAGKGFSIKRSLSEGFLSNVLNPKAIVFYMAFLPQFIDPSRSALAQSLCLAGIHFTIAMIWQGIVTSLVDRARTLFLNARIRQVFDGLTGSVMVFFGITLGLDR
ncbi:MAG: LysE family translocator [Pseudomonadota bacterium]